ncbi:LytR/AlgR family response regulator transcription factor [Epilithonimonas xixisoli]|uniref:LytTR family two component transcriptional regulator n=1 Tax=Epilithonimonas xixisoli TaxID=1476462 RepID=A0A4R8IH95_9FLAO|nr:LytTR family DNA-binding domain-containing protein [Epilithonimonas xixisoli]TDX84864.1 LytTR family two component transcriptional regulator [Epilithonimonas xixisoli]
MKKITAIIVEDSRLARNELKDLLNEIPEIEILAEAENADVAFELINSKNPDLIFLDIQLPGKDGFQLLEMLENVPMVIFTTAFDEFAIKSFEYNTLDYLLKPINPKRLSQAIEKVKQKLAEKTEKQDKKLDLEDQIFIKDGEKCWMVKISEIYLFEVEGNYTKVFFRNEKAVLTRSLNVIEKKLPQEKYFRANRNTIFNINYIQNIENWFSGNLMIKLPNDNEVEISRRQAVLFKEVYGI